MSTGIIKCCRYCTPETGRSPTCHSTCENYIREKAEYDAKKAEERRRIEANEHTYAHRTVAISRRMQADTRYKRVKNQ